ncbi:MAG: cytochrome c biogenesis protein CcdA [Planctomycetia bacterium]
MKQRRAGCSARCAAWIGGSILVAAGLLAAAPPTARATPSETRPVPVADVGTGLFDPLAGVADALGSPVTIAARVEPGLDGKPDVLAVTATLEEGWHLYSLDQGRNAAKPGGPKPTKINVADDSPQRPAGSFEPDVRPDRRTVDDVPAWQGLVIEEHHGRVTWRAPLEANANGTESEIRGSVSLQLCQDTACTPPQTIPFSATCDLAARAAAVRPAAASHVPERGHVTIEASFRKPACRPEGRLAWPVVVRLVPDPDWHLYKPASSDSSGVGQGKPTIVSLPVGESGNGRTVRVTRLVAIDSAVASAPDLAKAGAVEGPVTIELLLEPVAGVSDEASRSVEALIGFQTCSANTCDPPWGVKLTATVPSGDDPSGATLAFASARYAEAARSPAEIELGGAAAASVDAPVAKAAPESAIPLSLATALLAGLAGGLILNLMPCVLPVLGLKLMSFAQQSGKSRRDVLQLNLWYCAGLYAVFFVLATLSVAANVGLAESNLAWGEQFTSWRFNVAMAGIVFAFALSFLGVWELPIPGFIGEKAGHVQSQEGAAGSFLKGVLSTVLATPCSGPFLGPVFGFTLTQPTSVTYAVFGAIATGMALPYILVGLMPGLVRFLPKPGAWMGTFKEMLGFVMLGTVAYLFTFLGHDYFVPTFVLLIGIWAACWWVGKAQEMNGGSVGFGRWVQAAAVATSLATCGFFFLGPVAKVIEWEPFSRQRLADLRREGATVLIDFSADWCPTCKFNLATAIETRKVRSAIEENRVVPMLADWTDGSPEIKEMLASLQSKSIPVLAVFPAASPGGQPPEPIVLRDLITESQVLGAIKEAGPSRAGASRSAARTSDSVGR